MQCQSELPFWDTAISNFDQENPWSRSCVLLKAKVTFDLQKFKGQGYGQGQTPWSHLRHGVQSTCLLFVSWQSDHFWLRYRKFHIRPWKFKVMVMVKVKPDGHIWALEFNRYVCFSFRGNQTILLRYSKFWIWPWKVKVIAKVKPDGHIWALVFNRYICFSFRGSRTIFGWYIANSIFYLKKSRSRSRQNRPKSNQVIYRSGPIIVPKNEKNPKSCSKVIAWTRICGRRRRRRTNRYKNIKSPPVYRGDLRSIFCEKNIWNSN